MSHHRAYQLYAHITWHTSRRRPCLDRIAVEDVRTAVAEACKACAVKVLREAVLQDHVHLLVSFRPSSQLSEFIRRCKGGSARRANQRVPGIVRWARGHFVRSVGRSELEVVRRYIETQHQRHPELVPQLRALTLGT